MSEVKFIPATTAHMTDLQAAQMRRARMLEEIETDLGREMPRDEKLAFEIGWNCGFGDAVAQQKRMLQGLLDMGAGNDCK